MIAIFIPLFYPISPISQNGLGRETLITADSGADSAV
jgi:hypothetical protein